jgi:Na+/H+ antiporter NhaA
VEKFLHVESSSGVLLLVAAVCALVWANSPWAAAYERFLHVGITVGVGEFVFEQTVHFWINEVLMVVFFFVVGLEIRREIHEGELYTPVRPWFGYEGFAAETRSALERLQAAVAKTTDPRALLPELDRINVARREAVPPVTRIEAALHPWVAFGIMPLFALANAGVSLGGIGDGTSGSTTIALGVGIGLVVGKPVGIVLASWIAVRLGIASLPRGVTDLTG